MFATRGPSFAATIFSVYVAGLITSAFAGQAVGQLLVSHVAASATHDEAVDAYVNAQIISVVPVAIVSALIVWIILGFYDEGPTLLRAFAGMSVGGAITTLLRTYMTLDLVRSTAPGASEIARVAAEVRSLVYAPLGLVGLVVAVLIIQHGIGPRRERAAAAVEAAVEAPLEGPPPNAR